MSLCGGLLLSFARPALAEAQPPAVWYRASEGCPGGAQFLEKLRQNSRQARIAQAGDHIDFVVTLLTDGKETAGRLERQTDSGIVAIRELRDATCEGVADALALTLGLALGPGHAAAEPEDAKSDGDRWGLIGAPSSTADAPVPAAPALPPPTPVPASHQAAVPPAPAEPKAAARWQWSAGLDFGPMIGISTQPMPRGQIFVDARPAPSRVLPNLSLRAGLVAAWGSSETAIGPVRRWILASHLEACPVAWRSERLDLRPCAGLELGATGASADGETGVDDRSLWAAPAGQVRLAVGILPQWLTLELSGGALVPLIRNEIFSGSESLYRDAPAVFHAGVGFSLRLP